MSNAFGIMNNFKKYFYIYNQISKLMIDVTEDLDFKQNVEQIKNVMMVEVEKINKRYTLLGELSKQKLDEQYFE